MVVSVRNYMMKIRPLCICSVNWSSGGGGVCSHKVEGLIRIFWLRRVEYHWSRAKLSHTIFSLLTTTHCPPVVSTWHPFNYQIISLGHINRPLESTSHNTNNIVRKQYALQLPFAVTHFTNVPTYIVGMPWLQKLCNHFYVGTHYLGHPESMLLGHTMWLQNNLSPVPFKVRAMFCIDSFTHLQYELLGTGRGHAEALVAEAI